MVLKQQYDKTKPSIKSVKCKFVKLMQPKFVYKQLFIIAISIIMFIIKKKLNFFFNH